MKFLARPRGHDDVCSVAQCALPICNYYKQCSFNCVELGFFDNLNKIQINLPYVDAIHWLNQCNDTAICVQAQTANIFARLFTFET